MGCAPLWVALLLLLHFLITVNNNGVFSHGELWPTRLGVYPDEVKSLFEL